MAEPRTVCSRLRRADRYEAPGPFYAVSNGDPESEINIHSKVTIVDDHFVRIGSANLNRRSMGVDTECDIAIEAEHDDARDAIAELRNRLISEHLCAEPEAFEAAIAERGSVLAAIEHLNRNSRCLVPYTIEP